MIEVKGYWKDTYIYPSGKVIEEQQWKPNMICTSGLNGICGILKGESGFGIGITNIWYAVGNGLTIWDSTPGVTTRSDTTLEVEATPNTEARKNPTLVTYLVTGTDTQTTTPTNTLYMETSLAPSDLMSQYLREFGVFIGNATQTTDSGYMFNHVIHPFILKGNYTLKRQLKFIFNYI